MKPSAVEKARQLRRMAEAAATIGDHTQDELREAERVLGNEHMRPDEPELPLTRAA